jgi:hypothetical protein
VRAVSGYLEPLFAPTRGFAPALIDAEVITLEICGEYFKLNTDQDIFDYFRTHYRTWFPALTERSLFVRQTANLWQVKAAIQQRLTQISGQAADPVQVIDTLPLPVCALTRAPRERCFTMQAEYGYCVAKQMHYYSFKLGLRVARLGMITSFPLLPARPHDTNMLDDLVDGCTGLTPADKGFIDAFRQALLEERHGVLLVTPPRKGMAASSTPALLKACRCIRKRVEIVASQLTERFAISRIRVRDLWHFQQWLIRKVLARTIVVFLNLQLGRAPLDLDSLVSA